MSAERRGPTEVLRGLHLEGSPLRLGRARAGVAASPAAQALLDESSAEEELRQARVAALRQAHEEGLRSGRAEGLREGRAQAAEELRQAVQRAVAEAGLRSQEEHERLHAIAQHARAAVADLLWAAQDEIVALCYETLCRTVAVAAVQPDAVRAQLAHLMASHGGPDVVLHVHPEDAELLQDGPPARAALPVVADADVAMGGCILKTPAGALDARLDSMLEACKAALLAARAGAVQDPHSGEEAA
jgi:flagellar assembly protein FliH